MAIKKPLGKADPSDFYIYYERIKSSTLPTALLAVDKDTTNFFNIQMLLDFFFSFANEYCKYTLNIVNMQVHNIL